MRILVIEDEALIAMAMQMNLENHGHEVIGPAATPAEAAELAKGEILDLALVDLHLAHGTSGVDAARMLGMLEIPCLFVTAFCEDLPPDHRLGLGCLRKPYPGASLAAAVAAVADLRAGIHPTVPRELSLFAGVGAGRRRS